MIQDNLWGRSHNHETAVGAHSVGGNSKHLGQWQQFFGSLPHHEEKGLDWDHELHGGDSSKHSFDHGEHGTGNKLHINVL